MSAELEQALAAMRAEGARQHQEARDEFRRLAKRTWRDLGMKRPMDRQDAVEFVALVRKAIPSIVAAFQRMTQALLPTARRLAELADLAEDDRWEVTS